MRLRAPIVPAAVALLALAAGTGSARAQFPDKIKEAVEDGAEREIESEVRRKVADLFRCVWDDLECIRGAEDRGEDVALTDEEGNLLTDDEGEPISDPGEAQTAMERRQVGAVVGTIEMVLDGEARVFDVVEGPVEEGFDTGYRPAYRGEAVVLGASLRGRDQDSGATVSLTVGVWRESMEHMCDPFSNQLRYSPADDRRTGGRLRPGEQPSESCPPPPDGGRGGLAVQINLSEATLDEDAGILRVAGTFAGPLGRGDDAPRVSEGRFEAALRPFDDL